MPSSSLSAQLKQLAAAHVPGTGKGKASLLFTAKQAADIDIDSLFVIGRNALVDLCTHNPAFKDFEETLFSERIKSLDRTLQSKTDNEKLDESISKFLRLLSPYFLLQSTFKALEWLLRRFRINEFNVDVIVECILPYHETKQFVQVVGVLALPEDSRWVFLKAIQKTKVSLDRVTLIQRLTADRTVLEFICGMIISSKRAGVINRTLWTFFALTVIQYIQSLTVVSDEDIRLLLAPLLTLLRIGNPQYADLLATAQMVFAQIANRAPLSSEVVVTIVENAAAGVTPTTLQSSITFLLTIYRSQEICDIPAKAFSRLLDVKGFEETLAQINKTYEADKLLCPMFEAAVTALSSPESAQKLAARAEQFIEVILDQGEPSSEALTFFVNAILQSYLVNKDLDEGSAMKLKNILQSVQRRHGHAVDQVVEAKLKDCEQRGDKEQQQALYEFVTSTFRGSGGRVVKNANTTLYLSLQHVNANIRLMALENLAEMLSNGEQEDIEFAEDILLSRLQDDDDRVLKQVLELPLLTDIVEPSKLAPAMQALLRSETISSKNKCRAFDICVEILKSDETRTLSTLRHDILGCFLLTRESRRLSRHAFACAAQPGFPLQDLVRKCENLVSELDTLIEFKNGKAAKCTAFVPVTACAISILANNLKKPKAAANVDAYVEGLASASFSTRQLSAMVLVKALQAKSAGEQLQLADRIVAIAANHSKTVNGASQKDCTIQEETGLLKDIVNVRTGNDSTQAVELQVIMFVLKSVMETIVRPNAATIAWLSTEGEPSEDTSLYRRLVVRLYETISSLDGNAAEVLMSTLLRKHLAMDAVQFCTAYWVDNDKPVSLQINSLTITTSFINVAADPEVVLKYDFQLVIPSLFTALANPEKAVRSTALDCLQAIKNSYAKCTGESKSKKVQTQIFAYDQFYGPSSKQVQYLTVTAAAAFVGAVLEGKEELLTDPGFLERYIHDLLLTSSEKKMSYKEDLLSFLLSNILAFQKISAQISLVSTLKLVDSSTKMKTLHPLLESLLKRLSGDQTSNEELRLIGALIQYFTPKATTSLFKMRNDRYVRIFCRLLGAGDDVSSFNRAQFAGGLSVERLALQQIDSKWFTAIPADRQGEIFSAVVRLAYEGEQSVVQDAKTVLKAIPASYELILAQLLRCQEMLLQTEKRPSKKTKAASRELTEAFYRLSTILELLEYKDDITGKQNLVVPLFDLLGHILNAEVTDIPVSVEYVKQLILSVELSLFKDIKKFGWQIDEAALRVDLIVQCIRVTDNPQTHNASLLLMAAIATVYPQSVLLNIMPVFTFMGANVLRQDDNYSFHVIQQTLTTIIPPLVQRHQTAGESRERMLHEVKPVMGVFVDALSHIPKHRRLRLFTVLISTLGADTFLDAIVLMLIAKHSAKSKLPVNATDGLGEFTLSVMLQFPVSVQLKALISMLNTTSTLPFEQAELDKEKQMDADESGIIDSKTHSAKELRHIKLATVDFAHQLLSNRVFISKVLDLPTEEIEAEQLNLVEAILVSTSNANSYQAESDVRGHTVGVKFAKAMSKILYDTLGKANGLLSLSSFLNVVSCLMKHENHIIRRKAITLLDAKVTAIGDNIASDMLPQFAHIVEGLKDILSGVNDKDQEMLENKQTALLCLTTMANTMAQADPDTYVAILDVLVSEAALLSDNRQIAASSMVCLTSISMQLGSRVLPYLPKFMPVIIAALKDGLAEQEASDAKQLVILGALGSLHALVDTVPQFISPYVLPLLEQALHPALQGTAEQDGFSSRAIEKSNDLLSTMARKVAPRILLPAIFSHLKSALQSGRQSMLALFDLVGNTIAHMARTDLTQYRTELFRFFLVSFDYRRTYASKVSEEDVEAVENSIISSFLQLVMKLNETLFRPMFLKLVDWATSELLIKHGLSEEGVNARQLFFYRLVDNLLGRLKSIFAPYYVYVLDNSITKLNAFTKQDYPHALWMYIVSSLQKCFLYDNDGTIDAAKFAKLLPPLVNQIETMDHHGKDYMDRMTGYLVPCLGQLAVTAGKDTMWKPLNHQVLLKTRSEHAEIRLVALKVLQELYARLGEEMLILFPETIPFLAELMEDDDAQVEALCQEVCLQIQQYIGEDIQQYFNA
ncbi:hypothetical protein SpCBS45565_g06206 [Spizellomyces sp. 'palustris']|nr:hypothetical protein SpCBS45565_g06206 [Spizellomyces sp. 'palustris']